MAGLCPPYRRFVAVLADVNARLGADVGRYSFIVVDLHHLLLAGLPAHFESSHPSHAVASPSPFARRKLSRLRGLHHGLEVELAREVARQLMANDALASHARDEFGLSEISAARPVQAALALLGILGARAGGAEPLKPTVRVVFWASLQWF
jgi:hypothetical protein